MDVREQVGLMIMRVSLGWFMLMWSVEKVIKPGGAAGIFDTFYGLTISNDIALWIGVAEIILSLMIVVGMFRTYTYGLGLVFHAISTISTYPQLLSPYTDGNHLFLAGVPVLTAFVALWLLRHRDQLWAVDEWICE